MLTDELAGPNGLAFSPDERWLYVGNWDFERIVVMRYDPDTGEGSVFFDMTAPDAEDAIDGIKVDGAGNLYVCGPGGIWVLSPTASTSARSGCPRRRTTSPGATPTAAPSTSRR